MIDRRRAAPGSRAALPEGPVPRRRRPRPAGSLAGALSLALALAALAASPAQAQPEGAPVCEPTLDCAARARDFDRQVSRLGRQHPGVVGEALAVVRLRRRSICHARNACMVDGAALARVEAWAEAELRALQQQRAEAARRAWASGLAGRLAALHGVGVTLAPPQPQATPQVLGMIARLEEDLEAYDEMNALLQPFVEGARLPDDGAPPPICGTDTLERLRTIVRSGATTRSDASTLRRALEELCEPWERWREPDEGLRSRMRRLNAQVDRIEGWMRQIQQCIDPGPYDFPCRNTFGEQEDGDLAQTRVTLRRLAEVRRVLRGVPERRPFPCGHAIWARLAAESWNESVSQAQMPGLARSAERLCEDGFGFDREELGRDVQRLRERVEQLRARYAQQRARTDRSLRQMRATYGLPAPCQGSGPAR